MHHLYPTLKAIAGCLTKNNIFFVLSSGTLLGAVRAGELIAHDYDFDLEVHVEDKEKILALESQLAPFGISLRLAYIRPISVEEGDRVDLRADKQIIKVYLGEESVGDIFLFTTFSDGILRRYESNISLYCNPRHQTPAWFWEKTEVRTLYGDEFPVPRSPEVILESMYGDTWRIPLKRGEHAKGAHKRGGAVVRRKMQPLVQYALAQGWDTNYDHATPWPQLIRYTNSFRGRRLLVWSEPEGVIGAPAVDYDTEVARVLEASRPHEARKLVDMYISTGSQTAIGALAVTERGRSKVIYHMNRVLARKDEKIDRLKERNARLRKKQKAIREKIRYLKRNPLMAILRFSVFKITGRRGRWWRR